MGVGRKGKWGGAGWGGWGAGSQSGRAWRQGIWVGRTEDGGEAGRGPNKTLRGKNLHNTSEFVLAIYCWVVAWDLPVSMVWISRKIPLEKLIFYLQEAVNLEKVLVVGDRSSCLLPHLTVGPSLVWNYTGIGIDARLPQDTAM